MNSHIIFRFIFLMMAISTSVNANQKIAIPNFELVDITSLPNTSDELIRTASLKPMLEEAIGQMSDYEIIQTRPIETEVANSGRGYLFRFHDVAAKLGIQLGADWIIVGQHSKPSFLYSYLMVHVIDVHSGNLAASHHIELKGNHVSVTRHGIMKLAEKIHSSILKNSLSQSD